MYPNASTCYGKLKIKECNNRSSITRENLMILYEWKQVVCDWLQLNILTETQWMVQQHRSTGWTSNWDGAITTPTTSSDTLGQSSSTTPQTTWVSTPPQLVCSSLSTWHITCTGKRTEKGARTHNNHSTSLWMGCWQRGSFAVVSLTSFDNFWVCQTPHLNPCSRMSLSGHALVSNFNFDNT